MKKFTYFTDSILEEILKNEDNGNLKEAQNKLKDIMYRSYKYKGTVEDRNDQGKEPGNIVCEANFDYGAGEENPLVKIPFYKKSTDIKKVSFNYEPDELEEMLLLLGKFQMKVKYSFEREKEKEKEEPNKNEVER
ncbi:Hypothetical predicted protein [Octopus vulgaris]|uniref:Uncharacterized protein n=1 Tax=Octopus vulgaris TaxID=6645 RepID=A0AA36FA53_OCTVU|nr:Hypothetical predicted protein [Octopus vulgaris]